ncbi:Rmi1 protein [Maudiozyma humilis]|uniref:Rmi1 protein n=1 Tax=Maudiozyma humilis TaxID=51915 RepID=A0AAV5S3L2_MAUHU|nr:Rmi1 protein [Kazachstania humilis]
MSSFSPLLMQDITQVDPQSIAQQRGNTPAETAMLAAFANAPWLADDPAAARDPTTVKLCRADRDLLFQVLMVENVSRAKQAQLESLRAKIDPRHHRVDTLRQSKAPRTFDMVSHIDMDGEDTASDASPRTDVFKLTLQTRSGDIFFAINTEPLGWGSCRWGAKIVVRKGAIFSRGVFCLTPANTVMCSGSMPAWNVGHEHRMVMYLEGKLGGPQEAQGTGANPRKRTAAQADGL